MEGIVNFFKGIMTDLVLYDAVGTVWDILTSNPLLTLLVGASILSLGFRFFRKAKGASRG